MIILIIAWIVSGVVGLTLVLWNDRFIDEQIPIGIIIFCIVSGPISILPFILVPILETKPLKFINK